MAIPAYLQLNDDGGANIEGTVGVLLETSITGAVGTH
jgi:hypothetical protein